MNERKVYRTLVFDNRRWEGFEFRPGDVVISTPPKSGTTWTQMLVAMLIFDSAEFHAPMDTLSPWLDMNTRTRDDVFDLLASQTHRRFIKTHTPLDGLPLDPRVNYVVVGRDPRDVAISFEHHVANMDMDHFIATRIAAVGDEDMHEFPPPGEPSDDPRERMRAFVEGEGFITTFDSVVAHLRDAWERRHDPNVDLFHYSDYQNDLPAELQRLAQALDIELSAERAQELAAEARLDKMRARAEELAPDTGRNHWKRTENFFRKGGRGEWTEHFSEELAERYMERVMEYADGDEEFAAWLHGGHSSQR